MTHRVVTSHCKQHHFRCRMTTNLPTVGLNKTCRRTIFSIIAMNRFALCMAVLLAGSFGRGQAKGTLFPADSSRWELEGGAHVTNFDGRACIDLQTGAAVVKDFQMRDGVIDVDMQTPSTRAFIGVMFRVDSAEENYEVVYLRRHKTGLPDAMQYMPVINTGSTWQIYNGPGFTGRLEIQSNVWIHMRVEVTGAQAKLYVNDMNKPALVMDDLKSGVQKGSVGLWNLAGEVYFSNFRVQKTPDVPWVRHLPPMSPNTLTKWSLSPAYDALSRNVERPLSPSEIDTMKWQNVEAEPPGFIVINRYRESPHINVTFQTDFSTRLQPQPGTMVVYARTTIESDRDQVKKLYIGYSDEVSVFMNGKILFRGRSAQGFRDPGFLGIIYPEDDAVYLPLHKGKNELMLADSELGGGWAFICRLVDEGN